MGEIYRDELAAAQARIAELERQLAERDARPNLEELEKEHARLVRTVPAKGRVRMVAACAAIVAVASLGPLFFPPSPYETSPRLRLGLALVTTFGVAIAALVRWVTRDERLRLVAMSERLLASERKRATSPSRARVRVVPHPHEAVDETEETEETEEVAREDAEEGALDRTSR